MWHERIKKKKACDALTDLSQKTDFKEDIKEIKLIEDAYPFGFQGGFGGMSLCLESNERGNYKRHLVGYPITGLELVRISTNTKRRKCKDISFSKVLEML